MKRVELLELTASIAAAHVENNSVSVNDVSALIQGVYKALEGLSQSPKEVEATLAPAVSIRASVKPDSITCLECGKKQRTLKRHLGTTHGLTPDEYRAKWDLSANYPMVAASYSAQRSDMAKALGLGRKPGVKVVKKGGGRAKLGIRT